MLGPRQGNGGLEQALGDLLRFPTTVEGLKGGHLLHPLGQFHRCLPLQEDALPLLEQQRFQFGCRWMGPSRPAPEQAEQSEGVAGLVRQAQEPLDPLLPGFGKGEGEVDGRRGNAEHPSGVDQQSHLGRVGKDAPDKGPGKALTVTEDAIRLIRAAHDQESGGVGARQTGHGLGERQQEIGSRAATPVHGSQGAAPFPVLVAFGPTPQPFNTSMACASSWA